MKSLFHDNKNAIDYFVRSRLKLPRKSYGEQGVNLAGLQARLPKTDVQLVSELIERYALEPYLRSLSEASLLENILRLSILDHFREYCHGEIMHAIDIGSGTFSYAPALYSFVRWLRRDWPWSKPLIIEGIEVDHRKPQAGLRDNGTKARYFTGLVPVARYRNADFLAESSLGQFDLIFNFFPYMEASELREAGLPMRFFKPLEMAQHTFATLTQKGKLIMAHKSEDAFIYSRALHEAAGFRCLARASSDYAFAETKVFSAILIKESAARAG